MTKRILWLLLACTGVRLATAADGLSITWTNNMLAVRGPNIPGDYVEIWYLEAFCRSGSTHQDWSKTTIPHKTVLLAAEPRKIRLRTTV
ncbi:MAG TPA: hypothetical protein VGR78_11015, partial [Verrucomicrobiae bacterium]|nr:hypothetical protein [Verrucomicrobiae bacterium]